jgi:hypothetical protein
MESLALTGKSGLGLDPVQVTEIIEGMAREWNAQYKDNRNKGTKVLSELQDELTKSFNKKNKTNAKNYRKNKKNIK